MDAAAAAAAQTMQCMEVWGGNQLVDNSVVMAGLDAWIFSQPYGHVLGAADGNPEGGGDVYYVSACATGRITRLLVADVSGHGSAVCDVAGQLRTLMRRYVNFLDQSRFVTSMNEKFANMSRNSCFATAVVMTFFAPTGQLTLCNAGHPPPLLYRAAERRWSFVEESTDARRGSGGSPAAHAASADDAIANIPLGIIELTAYEQFDVRLHVGDLVLCYTDSLPESRGPDGQLLGQAGLLRIVRSVDPSDPATFTARLLAAVAAAGPDPSAPLADDVTVLLFRPNGLAPHASFGERLLAPFRILRAFARSLRPGGDPAPFPDLKLANVGGAIFPPLQRLWRGPRTTHAPLPEKPDRHP